MKRFRPVVVASLLLLGLPLAGLALAGQTITPYLAFPPRTDFVAHAPFSWSVFIGLALVILSLLAVLVRMLWPVQRGSAPVARPLPWWGWLALVSLGLFWLLAWTRPAFLGPLRSWTFTPLWLSWIVLVNALAFRRTGRCLLIRHPRAYLALFPLSAAFWWYFEYLNRFVQNWHYVGEVTREPLSYFLHASLAFSTVLPAVIGTLAWLWTWPGLGSRCLSWRGMPGHRRVRGALLLTIAAVSLAGLGLWPDVLFPLVWVAPLLLILGLQMLEGVPTVFTELAHGSGRCLALPALAALLCGFLWELWNVNSDPKWIYSIPFVDRFHLFEMPILGYAGYLPFGLECLVIAALCDPRLCQRLDDLIGKDSGPANAQERRGPR